MAEAVVSTILEQLASLLIERVGEEVRLVVGVDEEVEKLKSNFMAIKSVLEDAECKQVKEKAVGDWLDKLKDVSYDIEDVLDEWNTAIQKLRIMEAENDSKLEAENTSKLLTKVCSLMSCFRLCSRPVVRQVVTRVVIRNDIAKKIKDLNRALDVIAMQKNSFHLSSILNGTREVEWEITTSFVDESGIHGRDDDKKVIKTLLLSESSNGPTFLPIISIVGLGGIGKTTLAQQVFNDLEVTAHFDMKIWVCVSDPFDKMRIGKAILESITKVAPDVNEFQTVLEKIHESIKDKKFLLVLDDVWTEDSRKWEQLKDCLKCGSKESRVLVTTRNRKVAEVMGSTNSVEVEMLSDDKCWSLFSQISFRGRSSEECQKLEVVGGRIVKKCKGLPLAVKTLAGLLCFKKTIEEWQSVLDSEMWELEEAENKILAPLLISYFYLPSELKRCFLYCAIFPKDYKIRKEQLIQLWMAQDYLRPKVQNKDMELVGEEYFEKLAMRSFFQDFSRNKDDGSIITCKMHDMVHDLAQYLIKNECFNVEVDDIGEFLLNSNCEKTRHSMIVLKEKASFPISIFNENRLRSLVFDCNHLDKYTYIDTSKLFDRLTCLRALHFGYNSIKNVPIGINKLIHLRYLNISSNDDIKELPEVVCELYNLQTLNISHCGNLKKLPVEIGKLVNLRHLINQWTAIEYMPKGIERLTFRTLGQFVVSGDKKACKLECLRNLNHLGGELEVKCRGVDVGEINKAELKNRTKLFRLGIFLSSKEEVSNTNEEALEDFQPPPNLEQLDLWGYRGASRLSLNWMMSLTKLRKLFLHSWSGFERLSLWKLPCLESLSIDSMDSVKSVGDEFVGMESDNIAFPKLQSLLFYGMDDWEEWVCGASGRGEEQIKIMPCLRCLKIFGCFKLKTLPDYLLQSTTLEELDIQYCSILERSYKVEKAENWVKDCGFPKIRIYENPSLESDDNVENQLSDDLESSSPSVVSFHDDVEDELPETQTEIADVSDS